MCVYVVSVESWKHRHHAGWGGAALCSRLCLPPHADSHASPPLLSARNASARPSKCLWPWQLRELVPPQGGDLAAAAADAQGDSRRPKHVVLSDTIRLIKDLQLQLADAQIVVGMEGTEEGCSGRCVAAADCRCRRWRSALCGSAAELGAHYLLPLLAVPC